MGLHYLFISLHKRKQVRAKKWKLIINVHVNRSVLSKKVHIYTETNISKVKVKMQMCVPDQGEKYRDVQANI